MLSLTLASLVLLTAQAVSGAAPNEAKPSASPPVRLVVQEPERRVEVLVDGQPFTTYVWPQSLKKPVLYPIRTAAGSIVTRGFPPAPGERADHPHHVGLWFSYGDVDGYDFWNNSDAIPPERAGRMGSIVHKSVVRAEGGAGRGELAVTADWVTGSGETALAESTTYVFRAAPGVRMIDRITELRAVSRRVALPDNKEGMLGMRVTRTLEDAAETSGTFVAADGREVKLEKADASGVTGRYFSSEGREGGAVWGTRGRWTLLTGRVDDHSVSLAILDHPGNPGFPTYWHARGYGLFAANPLGQAVFSNGKERLDFAIEPEHPALFRYRVLILDGAPGADEMERYYQAWIR